MTLTGMRKQPLAGRRAAVAIRPEEMRSRRGRRPSTSSAAGSTTSNTAAAIRCSTSSRRRARGCTCVAAGSVSPRRQRARPRAGRARARLSARDVVIVGVSDGDRRTGARARSTGRCCSSCRRRCSCCCSSSTRSSTACVLSFTPKEGGCARQLPQVLHHRQPLADDLDDAEARAAGDADQRRARAADRVQDARQVALPALGDDDPRRADHARHRADRRGHADVLRPERLAGAVPAAHASLRGADPPHAQLLGRADLARDLGLSVRVPADPVVHHGHRSGARARGGDARRRSEGAVPPHLPAAARARASRCASASLSCRRSRCFRRRCCSARRPGRRA